jgi:RNA chaperone Hfq
MQTRTSHGQNFQDSTLERLRDRGSSATLYLNNRMALHGRILDFDPYVLLFQPVDGSPLQMIYKSAVVSVAGPPRRRPPTGRQGDRPHRGTRDGEGQGAQGGYQRREGGYRGERPSYREGGERPPFRDEGGDRPPYRGGGDRPPYRGEGRPGPRPYGDRPGGPPRYAGGQEGGWRRDGVTGSDRQGYAPREGGHGPSPGASERADGPRPERRERPDEPSTE